MVKLLICNQLLPVRAGSGAPQFTVRFDSLVIGLIWDQVYAGSNPVGLIGEL